MYVWSGLPPEAEEQPVNASDSAWTHRAALRHTGSAMPHRSALRHTGSAMPRSYACCVCVEQVRGIMLLPHLAVRSWFLFVNPIPTISGITATTTTDDDDDDIRGSRHQLYTVQREREHCPPTITVTASARSLILTQRYNATGDERRRHHRRQSLLQK